MLVYLVELKGIQLLEVELNNNLLKPMDFLKELQFDISNGATADEVSAAYPELKTNKKLISELHYDISNWSTSDEITNAYPELTNKPVDQKLIWIDPNVAKWGQDIARNIYKGTENLFADAINVWAKAIWSDFRTKPLSEQLVPTWEKYEGGLLQKTANIIGDKATNIFDIQSNQSTNWQGLKDFASSSIQTSWELGFAIGWVLWESFMAWLSTLTPDAAKEELKSFVTDMSQGETGQQIKELYSKAQSDLKSYEKANPQAYKNWKGWVGTILWPLDASATKVGTKLIKEWARDVANTTIDQWIKTWNAIKDTSVNIANNVSDKVTSTAWKISKATISAKNSAWEKLSSIPAKKTLTRDIPETVIIRDLWFTPTERSNIAGITWKSEGQYILEKGLWGKSKEDLINTFSSQVNENFNWIKTQLKALNDTATKSDKTTQALEDILEQLSASKKLRNFYSDDITAVQNLLNKWEYTLLDKHLIRQSFDKVNNWLYNSKWQARWGIEKDVDIDIRNSITQELTTEAKKLGVDVAAMNKELRAWIEMRKALLRRMSQEQKNNFIGLQDIWVSAILSWWDPITAAALIWSKKYLESLVPSISQKVYNLNKDKNAPRNLNRNATVTNSTKSSKLGLTDTSGGNLVKPSKVAKKQDWSKKPVVPKKIPTEKKEIKVPEKKTPTDTNYKNRIKKL